ncbi:MAG TPA: GNAT family N-acetyltransferase [Pirellulales bacterium]|jgi:CelD/BcsL family acetyltransferase involved in cellulose biosynthesis|nr:GNAT family N-acetyltransferase [Pirellulales bacterium]
MSTVTELAPGIDRPITAEGTTFRTVSRAADLHEYDDAWLELDRRLATPMQTWPWIESCAAAFAHEADLELIVGLQANEVVAAAPLSTARRSPGRRQELVSYRHVCEPVDLAFRDTDTLDQLAGMLARRGKPLVIGRMFADSPTRQAIAKAAGRTGRLLVRPQAPTPWIALDESWAAPEQKLSSRRRSDFRRARKHAEQMGKVRAELCAPDEHEVDGLLDLAFDIERRSWKRETGTALADHQAGEFYRRYARRMTRSGQFRVELLHIGQDVAAMQLGVVHQDRYWVLKVGYDPQFHRASPGILLMVEAIKRAVAEGLKTYELLGTVEPWIQVWTELERPCVSLRYYPANLSGGLALAADLIGKTPGALKKIMRRRSWRMAFPGRPVTKQTINERNGTG